MPIRVQRKRTKGWKMPDNTVCVTRGTKFGNPFKLGGSLHDVPFIALKYAGLTDDETQGYITRDVSLKLYKAWLKKHYGGKGIAELAKLELKGKNLACFCPLDAPCHADILLEIANQ